MVSNDFDAGKFVNAMNNGKIGLDKKSNDAGYVGSVHFGPLGIPNHIMGFDFRSKDQKVAQMAPEQYMQAMNKIWDSIKELKDVAASPAQG